MGDVAALIVRRVLSAFFVLLLVISFVFFFMRLAGDPVVALVGDNATQEEIDAARVRLGLDDPVLVQYGRYLSGISQGDFGNSYRFGVPALPLVLERLPATLQLSLISLLLTVVVAVPIGIVSALKPGSALDNFSRVTAVVGQTVPVFWLGIILIIVFAVQLSLLPAGGRDSWQSLVLPAIALSAYSIPLTMRLARSSMLEVLQQDYIRAAKAKGISRSRLLINHALRNASIPIVTVVALRAGHVLSGAVVLEQVFAYPGMGRLAVQSMLLSDFNVIQAFVFVTALIVVTVNLVVDVAYGIIDPRIRLA
jgi:peptide/nickel transport system permease protein